MTINATLSARLRNTTGKGNNRKLRARGKVPAVVYGHGEQTRSLTIDALDLQRLVSHVHVENTIIDLNIEGERGSIRTLIRELQKHPVKDEFLHVDFLQIHAGERITVEVPIRLLGTPPGVKGGGILMHMLTDLEVRCLPDQIPERFDVDIAHLQIGESVRVGDIALGAGVEVELDPERAICSIAPPIVVAATEEEEEAEGIEALEAEEGSAEPELIRRGREESEEEAKE